ncbi:hypothetical protein ACLIBG_13520 [Virgibacillus sp. W0181]|uniref:hypothetical protein n=1 Tax=Virgibacillus sp. W0181 TaxID=3391581 RepID=UPI003F471A7A
MQLLYKNEQIELKRDASLFSVIFEKVNKLIEEKDVIFSHLIIDGVEVYENHEEYIQERMNKVMQIEIVTRSSKEMILETMRSVHEYLERAVPALKELVDQSYERFAEETWEGIGQLSEGMQWMLQFKTFTQGASEQPANWQQVEKSFAVCEEEFAELLDAVEAQDTVMITDLLAYEITPAYEALLENIGKSLQDKEFLNYVN